MAKPQKKSPPPSDWAAEQTQPPKQAVGVSLISKKLGELGEFLNTKVSMELYLKAIPNQNMSESEKIKTIEFYLHGVLSVVKASTEKSPDGSIPLWQCTKHSIRDTIITSLKEQLPIDSRQLAYIIPYKDKATFRAGYKGYLYRIASVYEVIDYAAEGVFEGDKFEVIKTSDGDGYRHSIANPFPSKKDWEDNLIGVYFYVRYKTAGVVTAKISQMAKDEVLQIKNLAKSGKFWGPWFNEKAKVAIIRRGCKYLFASLTESLSKIDNEDYEVDAVEERNSTSKKWMDAMFEDEHQSAPEPENKPKTADTQPPASGQAVMLQLPHLEMPTVQCLSIDEAVEKLRVEIINQPTAESRKELYEANTELKSTLVKSKRVKDIEELCKLITEDGEDDGTEN